MRSSVETGALLARRLRCGALTAAGLLVVSACAGADDLRDAEGLPSKEIVDAAPSCEDVWVVGEPLPVDYLGCSNGRVFHSLVPGGDCRLASYESGGTGFYAKLGQEITAVSDLWADPRYRKLVGECVDPAWSTAAD